MSALLTRHKDFTAVYLMSGLNISSLTLVASSVQESRNLSKARLLDFPKNMFFTGGFGLISTRHSVQILRATAQQKSSQSSLALNSHGNIYSIGFSLMKRATALTRLAPAHECHALT